MNQPELTVKQAELVKAMKAHFGKKNPVSRTELNAFMQTTFKVAYAPGFIVKNDAFKAKDKDGKEIRGMYRLPAAVATKKTVAKPEKPAKPTKKTVAKPEKAPVVKKVTKKTKPSTEIETDAAKTRADLLESGNIPETAVAVGSTTDEQ